MQKNYFIVGKTCEDYCKKLDWLKANPIKQLNLNEDSFTNWKLHKPTESITKRSYNDGILEYECG